MRWVRGLIGTAVAIVAYQGSLNACSCVRAGNLACTLPTADVVFVGVMERVIPVPLPPSGLRTRQPNTRDYAFRVVESIVGSPLAEVTVRQGGSSCDVSFAPGQPYLVFAHRLADGALSTGMCSGTTPLTHARFERERLRELTRGIAIPRLRGAVYSRPAGRSVLDATPTDGLVVTAEGEGGRFETRTDDTGRFEFAVTASGRYIVSVEWPEGFRAERRSSTVVVNECGTEDLVFVATRDAALTGTVVNEDGDPIDHPVTVSVTRVDGGKPATSSTRLTPEGSFSFDALPTGRYTVGIQLGEAPTLDRPYGPRSHTAFVGGPPLAIAIDNNRPTRLVLQSGPRFLEREVTGTVVNALGLPVARAIVEITDVEVPRVSVPGVASDASGRFRVRLLDGRRYWVASHTAGPPGPPGIVVVPGETTLGIVITQSPTHLHALVGDYLAIAMDYVREWMLMARGRRVR